MEQASGNGGISPDLNWLPFDAELISSDEYRRYVHAQIHNSHFQTSAYHFPGIFPNHQPFPSPNPVVYPSILPSTPILGHHLLPHSLHVDLGAMVFPGGHQGGLHLHHPNFRQPMVHQFPHITSIPPMIHGGYVPYFREQQFSMNFPGMIEGVIWYPLPQRPATAAAHHFPDYYGTSMSGFMENIVS